MVRIWLRDGEKPKALAPGTFPRLPGGRVVDVESDSLVGALRLLGTASQDPGPCPESRDFKTVYEWHRLSAEIAASRTLIREVPRA